MDSDSVVWPDNIAPDGVKSWVLEFFATADTEGAESAKRFAEFFQDDAIMSGMTDPIHGKQAIYESRLKAWDTVKTRKHTLFKIYTIKKDFSDILIVGKLDSTMKNGRFFEMEFVAQVLFADPQSTPRASNYKIWADRQIAFKAAKGE